MEFIELHTILFSNLVNTQEFQTLYGQYGLLLFTPFFSMIISSNFLFLFFFFVFFWLFSISSKNIYTIHGKWKRSGIIAIPGKFLCSCPFYIFRKINSSGDWYIRAPTNCKIFTFSLIICITGLGKYCYYDMPVKHLNNDKK